MDNYIRVSLQAGDAIQLADVLRDVARGSGLEGDEVRLLNRTREAVLHAIRLCDQEAARRHRLVPCLNCGHSKYVHGSFVVCPGGKTRYDGGRSPAKEPGD